MQRPISAPASLDAVTTQWMSQALSSAFPSAAVAGITPIRVINGMATKAQFQITYDPCSGEQNAPPQSVWLKAGFEKHAEKYSTSYRNEALFFRDVAPRIEIECPKCYFALFDEVTGRGVVLLEDLVARGVSFVELGGVLDLEPLEAALDLQAHLHASFWQSPLLDQLTWLTVGGSIVSDGVVDQLVGRWDIASAAPRFTAVRGTLSDRSRILRAAHCMWEKNAAAACCLLHGDAHPGNLYFGAGGRAGYLDWQMTMRGSWAYDFSLLVVSALDAETRRRSERDLLAHYLERLAAYGASDPPSFETAWTLYRQFALSNFFWALIPDTFQPESVCTVLAHRACEAIRDLDSLRALGV